MSLGRRSFISVLLGTAAVPVLATIKGLEEVVTPIPAPPPIPTGYIRTLPDLIPLGTKIRLDAPLIQECRKITGPRVWFDLIDVTSEDPEVNQGYRQFRPGQIHVLGDLVFTVAHGDRLVEYQAHYVQENEFIIFSHDVISGVQL